MNVAALFVRSDSIYKRIEGCDAWDEHRDARKWPGGCPIVAHPPCRAWGTFRNFAKPAPGEKELAIWALTQIRRWGGVLEHPIHSALWLHQQLPEHGGLMDHHGGWTLRVNQFDWGHKALKPTWLYIVGCAPGDIPPMPKREGKPTHIIASKGPENKGRHLLRSERDKTPIPFAHWLCELAQCCKPRIKINL